MDSLKDDTEQYVCAALPLAKRPDWPLHTLLERTFLAGAKTGSHRAIRIFIECCAGNVNNKVIGEIMERLEKEGIL
jgi:hypothetical protein